MKVLAPQKEEKIESLPGEDGKVDENLNDSIGSRFEVK